MAVVINELEVTPQPTTAADSGSQPQGQSGVVTMSPDVWRQIQKKLRKQQEHSSRLAAY